MNKYIYFQTFAFELIGYIIPYIYLSRICFFTLFYHLFCKFFLIYLFIKHNNSVKKYSYNECFWFLVKLLNCFKRFCRWF